jgi:hypothetical protein
VETDLASKKMEIHFDDWQEPYSFNDSDSLAIYVRDHDGIYIVYDPFILLAWMDTWDMPLSAYTIDFLLDDENIDAILDGSAHISGFDRLKSYLVNLRSKSGS